MALPTTEDIVAKQPEAAVPANSEEQGVTIPEDVLQIPAVAGILQGAPAAVWTPVGTKTPETLTIIKHQTDLAKAGLALYRSKKEKIDVFYNTAFLVPEFIKKADEKGKLKEVAAPLDEYVSGINQALTGEAPAPGVAPAAPPPTPPPSSKTEQKLATARIKNISPGSPTSGPVPGRGRILNNILEPVI